MRPRFLPITASVAALALAGCGGGGGGGSGTADPNPPPPPPPTPTLNNVTIASGIDIRLDYSGYEGLGLQGFSLSAAKTMFNAHPNGAAAGDCDGDGDVDLFITSGDGNPNKLYRNQGNLAFLETAEIENPVLAFTADSIATNYQLGGAAFADLDGDDDLDLVVGGMYEDPSFVFENVGNCIFEDVTAGSGLDTMTARYSTSIAAGDYDRDGRLDLFIAHWGGEHDAMNPGDTENLWRNTSTGGAITFESVSVSAAISPSLITLPDPRVTERRADFSFTPTFARLNDDLWPDILSVADFNYTQVFTNNAEASPNTSFTNVTKVSVIVDDNGMGSAVGDYDNDGDLDWFVSSIFTQNIVDPAAEPLRVGNRLYQNDPSAGTSLFVDVTDEAGVRDGGWGWGSCFLDIDNDGDLDIYQTNGWPVNADSLNDSLGRDFSDDQTRLFINSGAPGYTFEERADDFGLDDDEEGRGVVCADFDNDGDVDILQLHSDPVRAATLWENDVTGNNNFLRVHLHGLAPNTDATGARIHVDADGTEQMREVMIGSNFAAHNPTTQVFGLGDATSIDALRVQWPDGQETTFGSGAVALNSTLTLCHPDRPAPCP